MKTKRVLAMVVVVTLMTVGITAATVTTDAVTHTEAQAEAWPWDGTPLSVDCILGIAAYGLAVVSAAWSPPPVGYTATLLFAAAGLTTSIATVWTCRDTIKYWYAGKTQGCDYNNSALIGIPTDFNGNPWYDAATMVIAPKRDGAGNPYQCGPCPFTGFPAKYAVGCGGGGGGGGSW